MALFDGLSDGLKEIKAISEALVTGVLGVLTVGILSVEVAARAVEASSEAIVIAPAILAAAGSVWAVARIADITHGNDGG